MSPTLHVLTPTYRPAGGVVKILDYATHALAAGLDVSVWCPEPLTEDLPLLRIDRLRDQLVDEPRVRFHSDDMFDVGEGDYLLVSLPTNYPLAARALPRGRSPERIIHLVQNVRHANPLWLNGQPTRLLSQPAARISVTSVVGDAIAPFLDPRGLHRTIALGHEAGYFAAPSRSITALGRPVRVAHTTWKSELGDAVERVLAPEGFEFRAIRTQVAWDELRELYLWADVFLSTPGPEEGFYMPGLEALEAGCLLVTPDVGGNMAYSRPGQNCRLVPFEDVDGYVRALRELAALSSQEVDSLRRAGHSVVSEFDIVRERAEFTDFLAVLDERVRAHEKAVTHA